MKLVMMPVAGKLKAWPVARFWKWARRYTRRYTLLEQRVGALERMLAKQSEDACSFCGERFMKLEKASALLGPPGQQFREETWTCGKCGSSHMKPFYL